MHRLEIFVFVNVYKVIFENNVAISAAIADNLQSGDVGLHPVNRTIQWLALECRDKKTALEIADLVAGKIWKLPEL